MNISGFLMDLEVPKVMGVLNITPDSFYSRSRTVQEEEIRNRVSEMIFQGADIIDIGGCSTRPGFEPPSLEEELARVELGCRILRDISPYIVLSIDTFRPEIIRETCRKWNVSIINDISGGMYPEIWDLAAKEHLVYVLTHNLDNKPEYNDVTAEVITELSKKLSDIHRVGVNDVIIDPGFGFAKTLDENFRILAELNEIVEIGCPVLVGVSRKSMIYKTLDVTPEESLIGTVALNAVALEKGADIIRVHDVKAAKETVRLISKLKESLS